MNDETLLRQALEACHAERLHIGILRNDAITALRARLAEKPVPDAIAEERERCAMEVWHTLQKYLDDPDDDGVEHWLRKAEQAIRTRVDGLPSRPAEKLAPVVTDAMVDAYLRAQSDYCARADADIRVPMSPRLACREGLQAALAVDGLPSRSPEDSNG